MSQVVLLQAQITVLQSCLMAILFSLPALLAMFHNDPIKKVARLRATLRLNFG